MSQALTHEFSLSELSRALAAAGFELFGFGMALWAEDDRVRKEITDCLLLALENNYFAREVSSDGLLSHKEYREEFYLLLYRRAHLALEQGPLPGITALPFYGLPLRQRAASYLKARTELSWQQIAHVLDCSESQVRELVEDARECLLGRRPFALSEEIF